MKKNIIIIILFLIIISTTSQNFCSDLFSPSIKFGVNYNRIHIINKKYSIKHSYLQGLILGLSNDTKINKTLYVTNDVYFKNEKSRISYMPPSPYSIAYQTYTINYLRYSSLLGIKIFNISDMLIGLDFGKIIQAKFNVADGKPSNIYYSKNMKSEFPKFNVDVCLGISRKFDVKKYKFILELKYFKGLTTFKNNLFNVHFHSNGLNGVMGLQL